jgi:acetylornithine deacetylase/succinyl-diaminopimelate desuccinylase-like protein
MQKRSPRRCATWVIIGVIVVFLATLSVRYTAAEGLNSDRIPQDHLQHYADLAVQWQREYLRVNTTNPPGNELRAASFFKKILDQEHIENRVFEYAPGRADLWARIPHTSAIAKPSIILLNHMDVVTSDPSHWKVPPFSAEIVDGAIYGRGAQDMKNEGLAQFMVMVMLKREQIKLDRDVIFLAVADEEVDDTGSDWFIAHQRELLGSPEFLINEGGENLQDDKGRVKYVGVSVGEKSTCWLHLVAHGRAGHGSIPLTDSAPNRLVRALNRVLEYRTPLKVLPVVEAYLQAMAPLETPARAEKFRDIHQALQDKSFQLEVEQDESLNYLLRDTISLTMLGGSEQTNVIPSEAWANLDVRLLPGEDPKEFIESIRQVVDDPNVSVAPLEADFRIANASPTNTALFDAIQKVSAHYFPGTPVVPRLDGGYTENQRYRPLGIVCYGFTPYVYTEEEGATEHGDNERIRVEEVRRGFRVLFDVLTELVQEK